MILLNILIIGAAGKTGTALVNEALFRSINITGVVRHPEKLTTDIKFINKDVLDLDQSDIEPFDIVINAISAPGDGDLYVTSTKHLAELLSGTKKRLMVVGSGTNLFLDKKRDKRLVDKLAFKFNKRALAHANALKLLQNANKLEWLYVAPPFNYILGKRTGKYVLGSDYMLKNQKNKSEITYADMAIMIIDQALNPNTKNAVITAVDDL
jgi:putative NADH-flavin reductase